MKKKIFLLFILLASVTLAFNIDIKAAKAGDCKASVSLTINPNPAPFNKEVTFLGKVDLSGTIWDSAGLCTFNGKAVSNLNMTAISNAFGYVILKNPLTEAEKLAITKSDPGPYYFMAIIIPSDRGFKGTENFDFYVEAYSDGQRLASSTSTKINLKLAGAVYENWGCVAKDKDGKDVYACSPTNSKCTDVPECSGKTCLNIPDSNQCGKAPPVSGSHKECSSGSCISVPGSGTDTCSADASCLVSVSGKTTPYKFEIINPIGITSFQDLVNVIGKWIFNLAIPIAVIMIIWGGVQMLTAGAFPDQFKKGQTTLKWAVIGLAVVLIGKGFVTLIQSILSLKK